MSHNSEPAVTSADRSPSVWVPQTMAEREAVREQVGRLQSSALFRNSKRFPAFLHYTVEHALTSVDSLKERTIGSEAFGRDPNYDTGQDPVVRMTATEVRKRLAQYYQQPEHQTELIVEYQPGSYVPEFLQPGRRSVIDVQVAPADARRSAAARRITPGAWAVAVTATVVILAIVLLAVSTTKRPAGPAADAIARFWSPLLTSSSPILICIGDPVRAPDQPEADAQRPGDLTIPEFLRSNSVRYTDALTLALITGELRARGKGFRVRRPGTTELKDLRDGPVVLIGGFNNAWTLRLSEGLRFTLATDPNGAYVRDGQHPDNRQWQPEASGRLIRNLTQTYGLITRVKNPSTGHSVLTISGVVFGTETAAECLIDVECLEAVERLSAGAPDGHNIQIVVSAPVMGQDPGAPHVLAVHTW